MSKKLKRGISKEFANAFKQTALYRLYKENKDDIIIGVRNNYLNLYYNCDSIAKVNFPYNKQIKSTINNYYLYGNDRKSPKHSSPKQSLGGYLFKEKRWNSKRIAINNVEQDFGDITKKDNPFHATFLFSSQTLNNLSINDIIDGVYDERIEPE